MMKYILHALITIAALVVLALALFGGYTLWNMFTPVSSGGGSYATPSSANKEVVPPEGGAQPDSAVPQEAITIPISNLTDAQRVMLRQVGIEGDTITITPEQIVCAEGKIGGERLSAIAGGATPTPLEAISLLPCL